MLQQEDISVPHLSHLSSLQQEFITISYRNAGIDPDAWQPGKGYRANRVILDKLYYYYQQLYFKNPGAFLWAGLARLTGGQVLYGMDNLVKIARDPCALTVNIAGVAKAIFENMAWQHELFLFDPRLLINACRELDAIHESKFKYEDCWTTIINGAASEGNKMLLKNEQFNTIQSYYDKIRKDAYSARYFWFTRFVMRNIHPYHNRFIFRHPFGDVTKFKYRWQWIEGNGGMWTTWAGCTRKERDRLVSLSNEDVIRHRW
jgi:hypothetical protein